MLAKSLHPGAKTCDSAGDGDRSGGYDPYPAAMGFLKHTRSAGRAADHA